MFNKISQMTEEKLAEALISFLQSQAKTAQVQAALSFQLSTLLTKVEPLVEGAVESYKEEVERIKASQAQDPEQCGAYHGGNHRRCSFNAEPGKAYCSHHRI